MDTNGIIEVTKVLIGETEPYGSSHIDTIRFDNQEKLIELTGELLDALIDNSKYKNRHEYSMQKIGDRAYDTLKSIHKQISEYL